MRPELYEISDEEWEKHSFRSSRVFKMTTPLPSIESFAYRSNNSINSVCDSSSDDCCETIPNPSDTLEDDDITFTNAVPAKRARRVVYESDTEDFTELADSDFGDEIDELNDVADLEDNDVVGKALRKCAKLSAELRRELYGSSLAECDRYAEAEASRVEVVKQEDIVDACKADDDVDFHPVLKPYQLVGVNFLFLLHRKGVGGAILADEMGLGKTVQAITYLALLRHLKNDPGPYLVVCPASLLENWERELKRWCPSFNVLLFHGTGRSEYAKELSSMARAGLPPSFDVLLVCYTLFERRSAQQKDDRKVLRKLHWSCVLLDEAHALKDRNSYRWKNLMSVARDAKQRLLLTGTPLQNDLHELWSLLEFTMPDLFATEVDLKKVLRGDDRVLVNRMKSILGPFILRRLKSDVMEQLVPKIQQIKYVFMERNQDVAYKDAIEEYRAAAQARRQNSRQGENCDIVTLISGRQISNYFVELRKIANHPLLVRRVYDDRDIARLAKKLHPTGVFGFECTVDRVIEELQTYNDFSIHQLFLYHGISDTKGVLPDDHVMSSAKCRALAELLPSLYNGGHKVLIFSQWTSMLDILEWALDVIGVTYNRLDGGTQVAERQSIVDSFNNDASIFACLLSTRAGGQGLNLTGADTVIIHDMDFNPQSDRQAEDRCHRIGQSKPVTIYRLVTKDTVDENVYEIAKRKLVLDAAVLESNMEVDHEGGMPVKTMGEILSKILLG